MRPSVGTPATLPGSYLVDDVRFPFCKGCGHTSVLRRLNDALVSLHPDPHDVVLVTDIGCIGLADGLFKDIHTVHTTHGRSTAFATGIALADTVLSSGKLHLIVLIGDGGAMIGLQHLVHAAMLNVNITVLICNNFVYGMTGGQGSGLTPEAFITATTPHGNPVPPADMCRILAHSNAPFVVRSLSTDPGLTGSIADALQFPGFSVIEILELCTEFAVPQNDLTGRALKEIATSNGWELGTIVHRSDARPYHARLTWPPEGAGRPDASGPGEERSGLGQRISIVLGGSAGEKVQSAAASLCKSGIRAGLFATQKNDNPVTQGSGFSLAEISVSPGPIRYTGIERPDAVVAVSEAGLKEVIRRGSVRSTTDTTLLVLDETLPPVDGPGNRIVLPFRRMFGPDGAATAALLHTARVLSILPEGSLRHLGSRRLGEKASQLWDLPLPEHAHRRV